MSVKGKVFSAAGLAQYTIPASDVLENGVVQCIYAEENLTIIGFNLHPMMYYGAGYAIANDGYGELKCWLTTRSAIRLAGALGIAGVMCDWNTSPAFGALERRYPNVTMFPPGQGVHMKEGEALSLISFGRNTSAGGLGFNTEWIVFYVKGLL